MCGCPCHQHFDHSSPIQSQVLPSHASAVVIPVTLTPFIKVSTFTGERPSKPQSTPPFKLIPSLPPTLSGTVPEASTDANVYLDLYGESGHLSDLYLRDTGDIFNDGQEDSFFFPNPGIGAIGSAIISHDDSGESPNWYEPDPSQIP